ncbi:MAG: tetratricopeptide repeat protein, partial [bacterium]
MNNQFSGEFSSGSMFVDISGFTALTREMMTKGKEGAELIAQIINEVFTGAIQAIYQNNCYITTFGGDAFNALTNCSPNKFQDLENLLTAACQINRIFKEKPEVENKFGTFPLSVKIGLSFGKVEWGIIKSKHLHSYYFKGAAIDQCAGAEKKCCSQEIIFDRHFLNNIKDNTKIEYSNISEKYYKLNNFNFPPKKSEFSYPNIDLNIQQNFYPSKLITTKLRGEFRGVISCFISFQDQPGVDRAISRIMDETIKFGGYFNRISFGDKGGFLLVFFGAPVSRENLFKRAADFALSIMRINDVKIRIGMTYGTAFAGFTGNNHRAEYTAQGQKVNLAARFMTSADFQEIFTDKLIFEKLQESYEFSIKPSKQFKGYNQPLPYYQLLKPKFKTSDEQPEISLVGRIDEIKKINKVIDGPGQMKFAGIIYVDGEPGIGKSRLINEVKINHPRDKLTWMKFPCDEILRTSLNPIYTFIKNYFEISDQTDQQTILDKFETKTNYLTSAIDDQEISQEIQRTKPILAKLAGIDYPLGIFADLDAKAIYENTLYALKNLIKAECLLKPVVIEIEDAHWIDSESESFFSLLTRNIENCPLTILASCRFLDDGSQYHLNLDSGEKERIELNRLDIESSRQMILDIYDTTSVPEKTLGEIFTRSEGNPFYLEQISMYLLEHQLLDDKFHLKSTDFELPTDINSIIISRVDRLTLQLQEVVKTASVLGREFAVKVLAKMLDLKPIGNYLEDGEKQLIWSHITELRYIFKHALIRESVYQMQLKDRLRNLHQLAAETIEQVYLDSLDSHYAELAQHYQKAEDTENTVKYLKKAAKYARENYNLGEEKKLYNNLLNYTLSPDDEIFICKKLGLNNLISGSLKIAEKLFLRSIQLAEKYNHREKIADLFVDISLVYNESADFSIAKSYLDKAYEIGKKLNNQELLGRVLTRKALYYHFQNNDQKALEFFQQALNIYTELNNKSSIANRLSDIAIFCGYIIGLDKVLSYLNKALKLFQEEKDLIGQSRTYANIGLTYMEVYFDHEKSLENYLKSIEIDKKMGNIKAQMISLNNVGGLYMNVKKYKKAKEFFEKSLSMTKEMGSYIHMINPLANLSAYYHAIGNLDLAIDYIDQSL